MRPSSPPSAHANVRWPASIRSRTAPPSRIRTTTLLPASANQIAPSASSVHPSGMTSPSSAHTRRPWSAPSGAIVKAVTRRAIVSPTISVRPSGVMTLPFGNSNPSAATDTSPPAVTRASTVARRGSPVLRSKPKFPTYAVPSDATTMSLQLPVAIDDRSAWVTTWPSCSTRSTRRDSIATTRRRPSGNQPRPLGGSSISSSTRRDPPSSTLDTACRWKSENHNRPSCQRGASPKPTPSRRTGRPGTGGEPTDGFTSSTPVDGSSIAPTSASLPVAPRSASEILFTTAGDHACTWTIHGVLCGARPAREGLATVPADRSRSRPRDARPEHDCRRGRVG